MSAKKYAPEYIAENDKLVKEIIAKKQLILDDLEKIDEYYQECATLRYLLAGNKRDLKKYHNNRGATKYVDVLNKSDCLQMRKWLCDIFIVSHSN